MARICYVFTNDEGELMPREGETFDSNDETEGVLVLPEKFYGVARRSLHL